MDGSGTAEQQQVWRRESQVIRLCQSWRAAWRVLPPSLHRADAGRVSEKGGHLKVVWAIGTAWEVPWTGSPSPWAPGPPDTCRRGALAKPRGAEPCPLKEKWQSGRHAELRGQTLGWNEAEGMDWAGAGVGVGSRVSTGPTHCEKAQTSEHRHVSASSPWPKQPEEQMCLFTVAALGRELPRKP